MPLNLLFFLFFFNDTPTTEIYTLSLHDALPISSGIAGEQDRCTPVEGGRVMNFEMVVTAVHEDRKSTRLNSSHANISYAVFCLKKKKKKEKNNDNNVDKNLVQNLHCTNENSRQQ